MQSEFETFLDMVNTTFGVDNNTQCVLDKQKDLEGKLLFIKTIYLEKSIQAACKNGNMDCIKSLLSEDDRFDQSILDNCVYIASKKRHGNVVKFLSNYEIHNDSVYMYATKTACKKGWYNTFASLMEHDEKKYHHSLHIFLQIASKYGKIDIVKLLLNKKKFSCYDSLSVMHSLTAASENGHINIAKLFLGNPIKGEQFYVPFMMACSKKQLTVIKILLKDSRMDKQEAFTTLCKYGYLDIVENFLKKIKIDLSLNNNAAIISSAGGGQTEIVKLLLLDQRVNPADHDNCALMVASQNGHTEVVKLLLADPRIDPSARNNDAIGIASNYGHVEIVKILLSDPRVDPSAQHNYAFRMAKKNGKKNVLKILRSDPRVDPKDTDDSQDVETRIDNIIRAIINLRDGS